MKDIVLRSNGTLVYAFLSLIEEQRANIFQYAHLYDYLKNSG